MMEPKDRFQNDEASDRVEKVPPYVWDKLVYEPTIDSIAWTTDWTRLVPGTSAYFEVRAWIEIPTIDQDPSILALSQVSIVCCNTKEASMRFPVTAAFSWSHSPRRLKATYCTEYFCEIVLEAPPSEK